MADADLSVAPPGPTQVADDAHANAGGGGPELGNDADVGVAIVAPITEGQVRALLIGIGASMNRAVGDDDVPQHWKFTPEELTDLVPPLTRVVNRRPALRRLVEKGDEATVAMLLAGHAGDNLAAGRAAKRARREADEQLQTEVDRAPGGDHPARGPSGGGDPGAGNLVGLHRTPGP